MSTDDSAPAKPATTTPAVLASTCVQLGWTVLDLYAKNFAEPRPLPAGQLPQPDQLSARAVFELNAARANACAGKIAAAVGWTGETPMLKQSFDDEAWAAYTKSGDGSDTVSKEVLAFHLAVTTRMSSAGEALPKAYQLGQALSRLCQAKTEPHELFAAFGIEELVHIDHALNDLATVLPAHAAKSVIQSLTWWRDATAAAQGGSGTQPTELGTAIGDRRSDAPGLARRVLSNRKIANTQGVSSDRLTLLLPRQGELWRSVLVGEKNPLDLLTAEDYIKASTELSARARALLHKVPAAAWRIVSIVTIFFGVVGLAAYAIPHYGNVHGGGEFAATYSALAATVAAWVAALWRMISGRMKSLVSALEKPLWEASLDYVCGLAISLPPVGPKQDDTRWMKLTELAATKATQAVTALSGPGG